VVASGFVMYAFGRSGFVMYAFGRPLLNKGVFGLVPQIALPKNWLPIEL
jgi:hypothetical protein